MTFVPFNESHAIESVVFAVSINRQIDGKDVEALIQSHQHIVSDLPALSFPDQNMPSIEFAFRRPDGTATWSLRCVGNEVYVECTRYTRWAKIWDVAFKHLRFACKIINEAAPISLSRPMMRIVDRFKFVGGEYNVSEVLKRNEYVPDVAFGKSQAWHANVGWFEDQKSDTRVLHNLNIQSRQDTILDRRENVISPNFYIVISHQQVFFSHHPFLFEEAFNLGMMSDVLPGMHIRNKDILLSLLTKEAIESIQLVGDQNVPRI